MQERMYCLCVWFKKNFSAKILVGGHVVTQMRLYFLKIRPHDPIQEKKIRLFDWL
jgi:hypothetical protein